jgi:hypothetical protein
LRAGRGGPQQRQPGRLLAGLLGLDLRSDLGSCGGQHRPAVGQPRSDGGLVRGQPLPQGQRLRLGRLQLGDADTNLGGGGGDRRQRPPVPLQHPNGHPPCQGQLVAVAGAEQQPERRQRAARVQVADVVGEGGVGRLEGGVGLFEGGLLPVGGLDDDVQPGLGGPVGLGQHLHLGVEPGDLAREPRRLRPRRREPG